MSFGKKFKGIGKKATGLLSVINPVSGMLGGVGAQGGPQNPFAPPDLTNLRKTNPYVANLPGAAKSYFDYKPQTQGAFNDLISNINAPSSVDAVRKEVNGSLLDQLLTGVDRDVNQGVSNVKMDALDRGIGGPGAYSDIEANALAQVRGQGADTKANARGQFSLAELDNLAKREDASRAAYGARYNADVAGATGAAGAYNALLGSQASLDQGRELGVAGIDAGLYNSGAALQQAGKKPSYLDDFLRNINISLPVKA